MHQKILSLIRRAIGIPSIVRSSAESLAMQRLWLVVQDSPWFKNKSLSPGGYAMDSLSLHDLFCILNDAKPRNILEFGLGQSSKLVHQWAAFSGANALTIEHDPGWITYFKSHVGESYPVNIRQVDLETIDVCGAPTLSYNAQAMHLLGGEYDLIVVDGPFGYNQTQYARPQILEFTRRLASDFCIFMHDSERKTEQNTLALLCQKLEEQGTNFVRRDNGDFVRHTVLCSESWKFLASL
jgi:hypothetical protein